jgi:Protein of unknown function (DUF2283)
MDAMTVKIGPLTFDHASYDEQGDVLYLHVGERHAAADSEETPEGHVLRFDEAGRSRIAQASRGPGSGAVASVVIRRNPAAPRGSRASAYTICVPANRTTLWRCFGGLAPHLSSTGRSGKPVPRAAAES